MKQVGAVMNGSGDKLTFSWTKTCQGTRERVYAVMSAAEMCKSGRFHTGDIVTVGYNARSDQVIMAAEGRSRFVAKVRLEATAAEEALAKLGWKISWVEVPDNAPGWAHKTPTTWEQSCR